MCGITGFIDLAGRRAPAENGRIVKAMSDALAHRGPDGDGFWNSAANEVWLGHRRLAIIDLSDCAAQPMVSADGGGVLTFNGEIYNYRDLEPELEAAGYRSRGHGDSEVLLNAIRHWGVAGAAERANGIFAFAHWDQKERTLSLVCDRLGKKPIYWAQTPRGFIFGSELRALLAHPDCPREVDRDAIADILRLLYVPAPRAILKSVRKLEPGTILTVHADSGRIEQKPYWSLPEVIARAQAAPAFSNPQEAIADVEALLADAVRIRRVADVPLGAFLSGGIDSSLVVAMMQAGGGPPVKTYSIGYASAEYDESADAARVAAHLGTDHHQMVVSPEDAMKVIPAIPEIFDEPFADMSQVPTYLVSKFARREVTVAITGDGGDEVFGGYNRHVAAQGVLRRLEALPSPARAGLARTITAFSPNQWQKLFSMVPARHRPRSAGEKMHKLAGALGLSREAQYEQLIAHWPNPAAFTAGVPTGHDARFASMGLDTVAWMRALDLAGFLPHDILTKVDRASMAVSLEARAPLLDYRLVELSFRIPSSVHIQGGKGKWILRELLARHVPRGLFERPKSGFGLPAGEWLRGPLRDWAEDLLAPETFAEFGLIDPAPVRALWAKHLRGEDNGQYLLWPVLMINAWCRRYRSQVQFPGKATLAAAA